MPITKADLKKIALSFPGAIEAMSYGHPAFKVEKKFFTRLRSEDSSIVWVVDSIDERDSLIEMDPKTYFITDHYKNAPSVLVRISQIDRAMLRKMLERRWQAVASKTLLKATEGTSAATAPKAKKAAKPSGLTAAQARKIALSFPGSTERWSMGSALFEVGGEYFLRLGTREPDTVQLKIDSIEERDAMIAAEPALFYITDHFKTYKGLLARLSALDARTFRALLKQRLAVIEASRKPKKKLTKR